MTTLSVQIRNEFSTWIAAVADAIVASISRVRPERQVSLVETGPNRFTITMTSKPKQPAPPDFDFDFGNAETDLPAEWKAALRGSCCEFVLRSSRFLFRPLDLPKRAAEFLDAMIRSQIDRLTPWNANEAVFSWIAPVETANDRISLVVIAAPKTSMSPLIQLADDCGAGSVRLHAASDGQRDGAGSIKVFERRMRGSLDAARLRRVLSGVLLATVLAAAVSLAASSVVGQRLQSQQRQLSGRISELRTAMRLKLATSDDSAQGILVQRKQTTPASVMVLEALSQILPDNTYVTELRIEKGKIQVVGITGDAPSLVKLMEQSPHFTRATFFAPTTRSANDPGERFHVEARIKPYFGLGT
jgi:general secretion pathway protein L